VSAALTQVHGEAVLAAFKNAYSVKLLKLPAGHTETDLRCGLLADRRGQSTFRLPTRSAICVPTRPAAHTRAIRELLGISRCLNSPVPL